ncbi:MAG: acetate kinase [Thermodesulfobacteriota bacterium]|nr:acetate kinase [Thermodesulfobacteriota bacterium]
MKILVINTGSSSIKYQLFEMNHRRVLAFGYAEKIGEEESFLTHNKVMLGNSNLIWVKRLSIPDHHDGLNRIVRLLMDEEYGVIKEKSEIKGVGHRVVHGGESFHSPTIIDEDVIAVIRKNIPLAPLHNPPNLTGIEVACSIFPNALQVAVFDTAFHQTIPEKAFLYAIPYELYTREKVRRYGFHGTSHAYVAEIAADYLGRPLSDMNLITLHLGNGASMAALKNGKCVDTTMGFTPLEGLVMGTRCGDVDPALPFFLADHLNISWDEISTLLNKKSGLKGICGTNDMREVLQKKNTGEMPAKIAFDVYCYRIRKYIGAYFAVLEDVNCLVFTAGVGENAPEVRESCCEGLDRLGIKLDPERNNKPADGIWVINAPDSEVSILVIPTDEELKIAEETKRIIMMHSDRQPTEN